MKAIVSVRIGRVLNWLCRTFEQNSLNLTPTQKKRNGNSGETVATQMAGTSGALQRGNIFKSQDIQKNKFCCNGRSLKTDKTNRRLRKVF